MICIKYSQLVECNETSGGGINGVSSVRHFPVIPLWSDGAERVHCGLGVFFLLAGMPSVGYEAPSPAPQKPWLIWTAPGLPDSL